MPVPSTLETKDGVRPLPVPMFGQTLRDFQLETDKSLSAPMNPAERSRPDHQDGIVVSIPTPS